MGLGPPAGAGISISSITTCARETTGRSPRSSHAPSRKRTTSGRSSRTLSRRAQRRKRTQQRSEAAEVAEAERLCEANYVLQGPRPRQRLRAATRQAGEVRKGQRPLVNGRKGQRKHGALHVHQSNQKGIGSCGEAAAGFPARTGRRDQFATRRGGGSRGGKPRKGGEKGQRGQGKGPAGG
eukprot:5027549-Heterocapsa_arctica.AAC.1